MNEPLQSRTASDTTPLVHLAGQDGGSGRFLPHVSDASISSPRKVSEVNKNRLGTINGVFVPCLLTITGVVMFLRFGWGVGQVGFGYMLIIFAVAQCQCISTTLSVSAIVTNGNMRGGGSYYMISRTLGPEFGGSIGILFYAAYCVNSAFFSIGCAEEIINTWFDTEQNNQWLTVGIASIVLFVCLLIALGGARYFTKVNTLLLVVEFLGIFIAVIAMFSREKIWLTGHKNDVAYDDVYYVHHEWSWSRFKSNFDNLSSCHKEEWSSECMSFRSVFAVIFPAFTGIMEGANLSGDLANPAKSLPVGTLTAQNIALMVYILLIMACAGSFDSYILIDNSTVMQETAWNPWGFYLVVLGVFISSMSSALGGLFGGSRIMQAIARDELYPYTKWLGYGSKSGDEPILCIFLTYGIAQCLLFIGSLDGIASLATCFFCLSYACVNFTCFLLEVSGTPNFRPQFRYYSWHSALFGMLCNLGVMLFTNYVFGLTAILIMVFIFVFLTFYLASSAYKKDKEGSVRVWGDVTQSILFHQVRKYLLRLDERKAHSKTWRPSVLLFVDTNDLALIDFANNLKKGGLYVIGNVISGPDFQGSIDLIKDLKRKWVLFCEKNSIKAFAQFTLNNDVLNGYQNLLLLSGLGAMQPNTVVMPLIARSGRIESVLEEVYGKKKSGKDGKKDGPRLATGREDEEESKMQVRQRKKRNSDNLNQVRQLSMFENFDERKRAFIVDTPGMLDETEYVTLIRDVLKYHRNLLLTFNFKKFDCDLLVSETIVQKFEITTDSRRFGPKLSTSMSRTDDASIGTEMVSKSPDKADAPAAGRYGSIEKPLANMNPLASFMSRTRPVSDCFVDVWLFASSYSFRVDADGGATAQDLEYDAGFPMLMLQLAHVLLLNKKWAMRAKLRVFLVMNEHDVESDSEVRYEEIMQQLRLHVDSTVLIRNENGYKFDWDRIVGRSGSEAEAAEKQVLAYWKQMNEMIREYSKQSVFTFLKLPNLPPMGDEEERMEDREVQRVNEVFLDALHVLVRGLPPTAIVGTGEAIPVISVDI